MLGLARTTLIPTVRFFLSTPAHVLSRLAKNFLNWETSVFRPVLEFPGTTLDGTRCSPKIYSFFSPSLSGSSFFGSVLSLLRAILRCSYLAGVQWSRSSEKKKVEERFRSHGPRILVFKLNSMNLFEISRFFFFFLLSTIFCGLCPRGSMLEFVFFARGITMYLCSSWVGVTRSNAQLNPNLYIFAGNFLCTWICVEPKRRCMFFILKMKRFGWRQSQRGVFLNELRLKSDLFFFLGSCLIRDFRKIRCVSYMLGQAHAKSSSFFKD